MDKAQVATYVSQDTRKILRLIADEEGRSVSWVVEQAISAYLKKHGRKVAAL